MSDFDSIPFFVAKQQGYLPKNVELQLFRSPTERDSALFAGALDGTISDALAVCLARDKNFDVYITSMTNGAYGILTRENLASLKDLEGKQIAMSLNTIIEYVFDTLMTEAGGDPSKVEKMSVPAMPSRVELLKNGQIDAIGVPEPYFGTSGAEGGGSFPSAGINPGVLLFTKSAIDGKKAQIQAFYKAYDKAVHYIAEHELSAFIAAVTEEMGMPQPTHIPEYTRWQLPDEGEILRAQDWLIAKDMLSNTFTYNDLIYDITR